MTLHQQFLIEIMTGKQTEKSSRDVALACSEISKEYAKGFAKWIGSHCYELNNYNQSPYFGMWKVEGVGEEAIRFISTDQLLSLYDDHLAKLEKEKIK